MYSDSMKDRIRQLMEDKHMTQQTFANFIGMSAASLSSIFNNRTKPTLNTVEAIKGKIPNISIEWLMFGTGSMYEDGQRADFPTAEKRETQTKEPVLDFDAGTSNSLFSTKMETKPQVDMPRQSPAQVPKPEIRYVERPQRQITEIRIFFDDGTYETFAPKK